MHRVKKARNETIGARLANRYLIASAFVIVAGLVLHLIPLGKARVIGDLTDTGHVLGFATLAYLLVRGISIRYREHAAGAGLTPYLLAGALALAFGLTAEALQIPVHRDASWSDVGRDACGIAAGLLATYARRTTALQRIVVLLAALTLLFTGLFGPGRKLAARLSAKLSFPVLADFESPLDLTLVARHDARAEEVPAPPGWPVPGRVALVRTDGRARYCGLTFFGLPRDWSGYETLSFRAAAATPARLTLNIRINDAAHDNRYSDRFNARFVLGTTPREIRIPLLRVRRAPASRRMDMTRIVNLTFFVTGGAPSAFYLDRIELHGDPRRGRTAGGSL